MIKSITVINHLGDSIIFDLVHPEETGFAITSITGLGPGKATINTTEVSTNDGGLFNSSRLSSRNIVISFRFYSDDAIEDIRQLSYKYFQIKRKCTLIIETDNRLAEIEGYVESNDPNIFSKEEGTDISIICPYPFFYSSGENGKVTTVFSGIESMFEFPFCNDALHEDLLEMGSIQNHQEEMIFYEGDIEVGITIKIHAIGEAGNITIYNTTTRESMTIDVDKIAEFTGSGIIAGDDIIICTVKGSKSITLIRDGISTNILNCLSKDTDWFQLEKGTNIFAYDCDESNNLQFTIENQIVYEGL